MYTQLLKDILIKMDHDSAAKAKLVEYCRKIYADNILQLGLIDEFNQDYAKDRATLWYNKESFLYSTVNRALRTQDIETILKMGFFARDLHEMIVDMHAVQSRERKKFTVYRGQGMISEELEKVKTSVGGLLSFNSFLSASIDAKTSMKFAKIAVAQANLVQIIFQMEIDPKNSSVPFAVLKQSAFEDESEILFSMHTVFRIMNVQELANGYFQVDLTLTTDNDAQLQMLTDFFRDEIGGGTPLDQLGHLMLKMGDYSQAEGHNVLDSSNRLLTRKDFLY